MELGSVIKDVDQWQRAGRGRVLQFFATDAEVQEWLIGHLPNQYAPFYLVGSDLVPEGSVYVEQPFQCEVAALLECMSGPVRRRWKFRIWSEVLTPGLELRRGEPIDTICSYNGLVGLQHGLMTRDQKNSSSIGITHRVQNMYTGQLVQHDGYLQIFDALRRAIEKKLCYATIYRGLDGSESESRRVERWTEAAVREWESGVHFTAKPGRLLTKAKRSSQA
jgi:hypothetical protein